MKPGSFLREPPQAFGNALTEYGVIGLLVLLIVLPTVNLTGGTLNGLLQGLHQDMASHRKQVLQTASAREREPEKPGTLRQPEILRSSDPLAENSSLAKNVATAGANGATRLVADQMALLAQQLKDKKEITDAQYNMLIKLANQGHTLGTMAALLEDAAARTSSSAEFLNSKVTFNGQVMTILDLCRLYGYMRAPNLESDYYSKTSGPFIPDDLLNPPYGAYGELQKFLDLYHQTMDSLDVSDPSVKQTVTELSTQIALLNATIDQVGYQLANNLITADQVRDTEVSIVTHKDSEKICKTGKGKDSGDACTP